MASLRQTRRAEIVALALVTVALILLTLPPARQQTIARVTSDLLLFPLAQLRSGLSGHWGLRAENQRLREELLQARQDATTAALAEHQNLELQGLLGFGSRQPVRLVPARLVDRNFATLPTTAVLDVGRDEGVDVNLPVVNDHGLIGKTVAVGRGLTRVMLYSHPDFSASALLVGGDHLEYGIVRPGAGGVLQLFLPLRSASAPGDRIVTSGYGGTFPRGIPIGQVAAVEEDARLGLQRIDRVEPAVDLGRPTVVFVMLREASPEVPAGDQTGLYWPGYAYPPMTGERLTAAAPESLDADSTAADSLAGGRPAAPADTAGGERDTGPPEPSPDAE